MLIDCPGCTKSYHVARAALGAAGREVVCPRCSARWFVAAHAHGIPAPDDIERAEAPEIRAEAVSERVQPPSYEELYGRAPATPVALCRSPRRPRLVPGGMMAAIAALSFGMAVIGGRTLVVRQVPRANALYAALGLPVNLRGVAFQNVRSRRDDDGGKPVLAVEGEIANVRNRVAKVPEIRLSLRDDSGAEIYSWVSATPKLKLEPGERVAFHATLGSPPARAADVLVRFASATPAGDKRAAR